MLEDEEGIEMFWSCLSKVMNNQASGNVSEVNFGASSVVCVFAFHIFHCLGLVLVCFPVLGSRALICSLLGCTVVPCACASTAWRSICLQESRFLFSPSHLCHCRNTQPAPTSAHNAQTHKYIYLLSVCVSVCLPTHICLRVLPHTSP